MLIPGKAEAVPGIQAQGMYFAACGRVQQQRACRQWQRAWQSMLYLPAHFFYQFGLRLKAFCHRVANWNGSLPNLATLGKLELAFHPSRAEHKQLCRPCMGTLFTTL